MRLLSTSDGSDCSDRATRYLVKSLRKAIKDLTVTLFYVDMPGRPRLTGARRATSRRDPSRNSEASLNRVRQRLKRAGLKFDEAHTAGNAASCIGKRAREGKYDLELMGSHGHSALKNVLLGSVTARVLSECEVPVLVVH